MVCLETNKDDSGPINADKILLNKYSKVIKLGESYQIEIKGLPGKYSLNDYSLSEIAAEQGMSRQGVHDIVKRCSKELEHYEDTLHLIEKFRRTKEHVNQIHEIAMEVRETKDVEQIAKIEALSNCILDML